MLGPAIDLAAEIIAGFAEFGQPRCFDVGIVQLREHVEHLAVDCAAFFRARAGDRTVPDGAAIDHAHHVEPAADHTIVGAEAILAGDGETGLTHPGLHLIFAVNRMGGRQQWPKGLAPQYIIARLRFDLVSRVRLPAFELGQVQRAFEALHICLHPIGKAAFIKLVCTLRLDRADKGFLGIHCSGIAH